MEERDHFSFRETTKRSFPPFKNKWAILSIYALSAALAIGITINDYRCYNRDLTRYEAGEINKKPDISDYSPISKLEKWLSSK